MSEISQREKSMVIYEQKFKDIMRMYSISKDQLEDLLSGAISVDGLLNKNDSYHPNNNELARIRLQAELEELKNLNQKKN